MKCCDCGEFKGDVKIKGHFNKWKQPFYVDKCIADIVQALNDGGLETVASCCGHNKIDGNIMLRDSRILTITKVEPKDIKEFTKKVADIKE